MPLGLPSLPLQISSLVGTVAQDVTALQNLLFPTPPPVYGIFNSNGQPVVTGFDSVIGFAIQRDYQISDAPIEQGGFTSYNKVAQPFTVKFTFVVSGGEYVVGPFVAQLEALVADTNLYTAVMPEAVWQNVNIMHYDTNRNSAHGFDLVSFDVWGQEVRQAGAPQFSSTQGTQASPTNTQNSESQATQSGGNVQMNALGTTSNPFPVNALGTTSNPFAAS